MNDGRRVIIAGAGHHLPDNVISNFDIEKQINTSNEFIRTRTGVRERRHISSKESLSDLIKPAAERALSEAGMKPEDIDLLIVNSLSPDYHDPSQACLVQPILGLRHVPSLDIRAQCSGLLYGMDIASQYIKAGGATNVMVVCAEILSKRMDRSDEGRNLSILLGDGAGACILRAANESDRADAGLVDLVLGADGVHFELLHTAAPGSRNRTFRASDNFEDGLYQFRMQGRAMFEHASETLEMVAKEILVKHRLTVDDIDLLIPHQPNLRILDEVQRRLDFPAERCQINVDMLGNMASASLPVTLSLARRTERMRPGALTLFLAYGAGATWGAALYRS